MFMDLLIRRLRHRGWGYPLICSLLLIPIAGWLSPHFLSPEGKVYLIYLPLAACIALLRCFDWRALPGIAAAVLLRYASRLGLEIGITMMLLFLGCLSLSWLGYRWRTRRRWCAAPGSLSLARARLLWLVALPSLLFILGLQLLIGLGALPDELGLASGYAGYLRSLVNFQALLLGCLTAMPLFYAALRCLVKPRCALALWRRFRREKACESGKGELRLWLLVLGCMLSALCYRMEGDVYPLLNDYGLTLLLPVMLYSAMRFGYQFNSVVWPVTLLVLFTYYRGYMQWDNPLHNIAFISSMLLVFTLCIFLVSAINTRQRATQARAQNAALRDPMIGLPNLRALRRDLAAAPHSTLCFLRVAELDLLSHNYGMQLRIRFKQQLAALLRQVLKPDDGVYHLPGYDLLLRLEGGDAQPQVARIYLALEKFRLVWNGLPIHPSLGIGYGAAGPGQEHLYPLLGELSSLAEVSLSSGRPENAQHDRRRLQEEIRRKVAVLHGVQQALDHDGFVLMAQPILGVRGGCYHEILLRLPDAQGGLLPPDAFLPVAHEFGLTYALDMWVLRHTLQFMARQRDRLPQAHFAVNLSPSSLCRPMLSQDLRTLLRHYRIEPARLMLEVTESHLLQETDCASASLQALRALGCRLAIDDFGTGYSSYERLKMLQVDTLKIDGSFVRGMLTNPLDRQIIASICEVAQLKRLRIVAEYVESEEQFEALKTLGVSYMQGYYIGRPQPLAQLAADAPPAAEGR
jgi:EAL domain-containing protein (putative c-di-GMP-specific phosphodiesterase class I)/GGDEF domain-containing protein